MTTKPKPRHPNAAPTPPQAPPPAPIELPPRKSRFAKEQKEGLARFIGSVAAADFIAAIAAASGHSPLHLLETAGLFIVCPILLCLAWQLRRPNL